MHKFLLALFRSLQLKYAHGHIDHLGDHVPLHQEQHLNELQRWGLSFSFHKVFLNLYENKSYLCLLHQHHLPWPGLLQY